MAFRLDSTYDVLHVVTTVKKLTLCRNSFPIYDLNGAYIRNLSQTYKHTLTIDITQTAFYIIFGI